MKTSALSALVAAFLCTAAAAASHPVASNPMPSRICPAAPYVEFTVSEPFVVESVTCSDYFVHADFQQYGSITGTGCTSTGALVDMSATFGNVAVDLQPVMTSTGCRVDSIVVMPGTTHVAISCGLQ